MDNIESLAGLIITSDDACSAVYLKLWKDDVLIGDDFLGASERIYKWFSPPTLVLPSLIINAQSIYIDKDTQFTVFGIDLRVRCSNLRRTSIPDSKRLNDIIKRACSILVGNQTVTLNGFAFYSCILEYIGQCEIDPKIGTESTIDAKLTLMGRVD